MRTLLSGLAAALTLAACTADAEPRAEMAAVDGPVLAELFTSQGCSSCPPAEGYFETLAERDGVAVIVWHVDVWDDLVHGRAGAWKDPYSSPAFTARQRAYNVTLRGTPQVWTPQAIVGGETAIIGGRTSDIDDAIENAEAAVVSVSIADGKVSLSGSGEGEVVWVRLLREHVTEVARGENHGRTLSGKNIALEGKILGAWDGEAISFDLPDVNADETCAVIVQTPKAGRVLGVGMCG